MHDWKPILMKLAKLPLSMAAIALWAWGPYSDANTSLPQVYKTATAPIIDGQVDSLWQAYNWQPMDFLILGDKPTAEDFSGRFKLTWDENALYLLTEITDDVLSDAYPDPTQSYWDDDCLEIFLDPDGSGGDHLYNDSAFAYHLALDGHAVDIGNKAGEIVLLDHHVENQWRRQNEAPYRLIWEAKIGFFDSIATLSPSELKAEQIFGFMLAYCDADGQGSREHFMGSTPITPIDNDKNLGYKTADVFAKMQLNNEIRSQKNEIK